MNLHNITTIAFYEAKIIGRSWLYRFFITGSIVFIGFLQLCLQSNWVESNWEMIATASTIPYVNAFLFNLLQAIIAVIMTCEFSSREHQSDTLESIRVRPTSNSEYTLGKMVGMGIMFAQAYLLTMALALAINLFASDAPFHFGIYLFYACTLVLPSFLFISGLSFFTTYLLRDTFLTLIIPLGFFLFSAYYLTETAYGLFDFRAVVLPNQFSDITGHPAIKSYLLQRGMFLFLSIGLGILSILFSRRIPNSQREKINTRLIAFGTCLIAFACGTLYITDYHTTNRYRKIYREVYAKYDSQKKCSVQQHAITFTQKDRKIFLESQMIIRNTGDSTIDNLTLYLNPSLKLTKLNEEGKKELTFTREHQVILVERSLKKEEELNLRLSYEGNIDERICYLDTPDKKYNHCNKTLFQYGKKHAFLTKKFTLLTPESLWYPVTTPPANPKTPYQYKKEFTHYRLKVKGISKKTSLVTRNPTTKTRRTTLF